MLICGVLTFLLAFYLSVSVYSALKVLEHKVAHVRDLTTGFDSSKPGNKATLPTQSSNMITFYLSNKTVVTL